MKKAQGLPMTTIVLIILVLIVLAIVAIFFVTQVGTGEKTTGDQQNFATCQIRCKRAQEIGKAYPSNVNMGNVKTASDFCVALRTNVYCDDYMLCEVTFGDGSKEAITC